MASGAKGEGKSAPGDVKAIRLSLIATIIRQKSKQRGPQTGERGLQQENQAFRQKKKASPQGEREKEGVFASGK